jgi:lipoate-protein ligase A
MSLKFDLYISTSQDVFENLALENKLLMQDETSVRVLLWSSTPAVVMGRFQNPWIELNLPFLEQENVAIARRQSGGGTIVSAPGNLNYCFIHPQRDFNKELNHDIIIKTLQKVGVSAHASGRSDLFVEHAGSDFKISGSAFKQKKDRSFHHGTLLIDADKAFLSQCLKSPFKVENSKSIASNPNPVINLSEIVPSYNQDRFIQSLKEVLADFGEVRERLVSSDESSREYQQHVQSWEWQVGETPYFEMDGQSYKKGIHLESGEKINLFDFNGPHK